jgi:hypothetical protein
MGMARGGFQQNVSQYSSGVSNFPMGGMVTRQHFSTNFQYPNERGAGGNEGSHDQYEEDSYMEGEDD